MGRERLQHLPASHGDQEEQAPARDAQGLEQFVDGRHVAGGLGGGQRVDLQRHLQFLGPAHGLDGAVESAIDAADRVVTRRRGPVQAEPQAFNRMLLQPHQHVAGEQGGGGGRDRNPDPEPAGFVDQVEQVLTRQRIAAGEDQLRQGLAELDDLSQKRDTLFEGQLAGGRFGLRLGAAVAASQGAGLRRFPIDV